MLRLTLICAAATAATKRVAFPLDEPIDAPPSVEPLPRHTTAFSSPRLSARQTAALLELDAAITPALDDLDAGRWAGRALRDIEASEADALAAWRRDPAAAPHGGESLVDLCQRVGTWLATLHASRGNVVAVTHPPVIRAAMLSCLSAPPESFWRIDVPPLASVTLTGLAERWNLRASDARFRRSVAPVPDAGQDGATTEEGGPDAEFPP